MSEQNDHVEDFDDHIEHLKPDVSELVSLEDALRVQLASERMVHAQTVLRMLTLEKDALLKELSQRYELGPGDGVDFASRRIVRKNGRVP